MFYFAFDSEQNETTGINNSLIGEAQATLTDSLTTASSLQTIFALLVIYQVKHFIADYPLQTPYMMKKFSTGWDFLAPLSLHCGVHALLTLGICLVFAPSLWWLAVVDFVVHFVMDRIKAGPRYLGRYSDMRKSAYWITFGLDQMVHHLTHIYIVWMIVTHH